MYTHIYICTYINTCTCIFTYQWSTRECIVDFPFLSLTRDLAASTRLPLRISRAGSERACQLEKGVFVRHCVCNCVCLSPSLSMSLSVALSLSLFLCVFVCLSVFLLAYVCVQVFATRVLGMTSLGNDCACHLSKGMCVCGMTRYVCVCVCVCVCVAWRTRLHVTLL